MLGKCSSAILALGMILMLSCGSSYAQKTVYKWVDEDGVVHYGEEPPSESPEAEVDVFTTDPAPPYVPPAQTAVKSPSASAADVANPSVPSATQTPPAIIEPEITEMSLTDLDHRCEAAREKKIAPLKAAEIEKCIRTETGDQAWCETFWADYGDASRTRTGVFVPRKFDDLPECVDAWEERNRRGLYPGDAP